MLSLRRLAQENLEDRRLLAYGDSPLEPGLSALDILTQRPDAADGIYWIDPDGPFGQDPFQVYADMTTDGGGWMLGVNSVLGSEAAQNNIDLHTGAVDLAFGHTRDLGDLLAGGGEFRHQIDATNQGQGAFHAKYTRGSYTDSMPAYSSWIDLGGVSNSGLLAAQFGSPFAATTFGSNWYFSGAISSIPATPSDGSAGPTINGNSHLINSYRIWVRELVTPPDSCSSSELGASPCSPATSAKQILESNPAAADGLYWIDPDGPLGEDPFQVYADMSTDGGGWMLAVNSVLGSEAPSNNIDQNLGMPDTNLGHTRDVSPLLAGGGEFRHQINAANVGLGAFHAKYSSGAYSDVMPAFSSWTDLAGASNTNLLLNQFGSPFVGTAFGANWYYSGAISSIPSTPFNGFNGPTVNGTSQLISSYRIWVREFVTPNSGCRSYALGESPCSAAVSAKQIRDFLPTAADGVYWIDPDGAFGEDPFQVVADMTTDGGGWTLGVNSVLGSEAPNNQPYQKLGEASLVAGHTRNLFELLGDGAQFRHEIDAQNQGAGVFNASYNAASYQQSLPGFSAWQDLVGSNSALLASQYGQGFGSTPFGAPWYYGSEISSIPATPSNGSNGPSINGPDQLINSYRIWIRENTTPGVYLRPIEPIAITLDASEVNENVPIGTAIGNLGTVDANFDETHEYSLVSGVGDQDNGSFQVSGGQLLTAAAVDFEQQASFSIRVRSTDSQNLSTEQVFVISLVDLPELVGIPNFGDGSPQRSRIERLQLTFDGPVNIAEGGLIITKRGIDGGEVATSLSGPTIDGLGQATYELSFSGSLTRAGGALVDGNFQLDIDGTKIDRAGQQLDVDQDGLGGDSYQRGTVETDAFFALYADTNGDRVVGIAEFGQFRATFGKTPTDEAYDILFDFEGNAAVGISDFGQFRARFGKTLDFE